MSPAQLAGLRVLVVEDEALVSMDLEDMLLEFGCAVAATAARVSDALAAIEHGAIDAAILDVNLGREKSYPVAERLASIGIPFLLATGYDSVEPAFAARPRLQKPVTAARLRQALTLLEATRQPSL